MEDQKTTCLTSEDIDCAVAYFLKGVERREPYEIELQNYIVRYDEFGTETWEIKD